jgi:CBS domain-containing protein
MKLKNLMAKDVKTCRVWDDLNTAAQIMWDHDCGCVPVLDDMSKLVGMLTDRDICMAAYTQGKPLREMQVKSAMSKTVHTCSLQDTLSVAENLMQAHKVRRLPVLDGQGLLVGIISLHDIAREAVRQRSAMSREVSDDEVGRTLAKICEGQSGKTVKRGAAPVVAGSAQP